MIYKFVAALDKRFGFEHADAHCDVPCGIYDPSTALIAAADRCADDRPDRRPGKQGRR